MVIFLIFFIAMFAIFGIMNNQTNDKEYDTDTSNENQNKTVQKIGNINNIEVYVTDYKYDATINGYKYNKINANINNDIKKDLTAITLEPIKNETVYGKFKMVIDNRTFFFDLGNDYALYLDENQVISFPDEIKRKMVATSDTCSCCQGETCKINLCACNQTN